MRNTNLKEFVTKKEREFEELKTLHVEATASNVNVLYQKYSYSARALEGQMKRIKRQIKGAFLIMENINSGKWVIDHLVFMEKLAEDEFSCHILVDSKFHSVKLEFTVNKVIEEMGVSNNSAALINLKDIKSKLVVNLKRYADFNYKLDWIRDRYFEIANFIEFKNGKTSFEYNDVNSIYDMVVFGDKNMKDMVEAGLFYNVIKVRYDIIKLAAEKEMFFLAHSSK